MLLLLDNYEHLAVSSSVLDELLQQSPHLKLLVTSRVRLQSRWEWVFELAGLATSPSIRPGQETESSASDLFVERARQIRPGFTLDETNQADVALHLRPGGGVAAGHRVGGSVDAGPVVRRNCSRDR